MAGAQKKKDARGTADHACLRPTKVCPKRNRSTPCILRIEYKEVPFLQHNMSIENFVEFRRYALKTVSLFNFLTITIIITVKLKLQTFFSK